MSVTMFFMENEEELTADELAGEPVEYDLDAEDD